MDSLHSSRDTRPIECPACGHELSSFSPPVASRGERAAAQIAKEVASWGFPLAILLGVIAWGVINVVFRPFEPFPVVVLGWISAVLATLAACQGPLILLSQRRSAMNDRERDEEAFRVSLHAESDIHDLQRSLALLHEKFDTLQDRRPSN